MPDAATTLILEAELTFHEGGLRRGLAVHTQGGQITSVGPGGQAGALRLPGRALLPGFVNGHSHAFQRLIRGRTQRVPAAEPGADFWTWRARMYDAATALTPEEVEAVTRFAYVEMLRAGFTCVAEFHYLHHAPGGDAYADPAELSARVLAAAASTGMRIRLLPVAYERGGAGIPLEAGQRRFAHRSVDAYLRLVEAAAAAARRQPDGGGAPLASVGHCIHSVRAVSRPWMEAIAAESAAQGTPLHAHASEQPGEIRQCLAEHGLRPVALLGAVGALSPRATVVHGIHLSPEEIAALGEAAATVCACPTTERDLGDGIVPADLLRAAGAGLSLGTDSHAHVDPFAEMRALEGHLRLAQLKRCVLREEGDGSGAERAVAPALFDAATLGGARSLDLPVGRLAVGAPADLITLDLDDLALCGWDDAHLLDALVFAGRPAAVKDVFVAGRRVVEDGHHPQEGAASAALRAVARRLWGG